MVHTATAHRALLPLLLPLLLAGVGQSHIVRRAGGACWPRRLVLAVVVLILCPTGRCGRRRPFYSKLQEQHPTSAGRPRVEGFTRFIPSAPTRSPASARLLPQTSQPSGSSARPMTPTSRCGGRSADGAWSIFPDRPAGRNSPARSICRRRGFNLKEQNISFDVWLKQSGAELVATTNATLKVNEGSQPWYVVRFPKG